MIDNTSFLCIASYFLLLKVTLIIGNETHNNGFNMDGSSTYLQEGILYQSVLVDSIYDCNNGIQVTINTVPLPPGENKK